MSLFRPPAFAQTAAAAGFLSVFVVPCLLVLSTLLYQPYLAFGTVMLVFPLLRVVFGVVPAGEAPEWDERIAGALDRIGTVYGGFLLAAVGLLLFRLHSTPEFGRDAVGWALSLWVTLLFSTCVSHDLLHRRPRSDRILGHLLAGLAGYPLLGYEHSRHHKLPGNTAAAEWPRMDENVWRFGLRRLGAIVPETLGGKGMLFAGNPKSPTVRGLRFATGVACITLVLFGLAGGWEGAAVYASAAALVAFSIQVITYLQHWGLGDDACPDARMADYGWENDCRFQAWVTLNLSLHQAHHRRGSLSYYRIGLSPNSPRLPTGYVLLMFLAFVPPWWRKVMGPALTYWKAQPTAPLSAGRRLACVALYK